MKQGGSKAEARRKQSGSKAEAENNQRRVAIITGGVLIHPRHQLRSSAYWKIFAY